MASDFQNLPNDDAAASQSKPPNKYRAAERARRGLRSLAISLAIPAALTATVILQFGAGGRYRKLLEKPYLLPPLWLVHGCSMGSAALMGLASWLVWADGGFQAESAALPLYVAQVSLAIVWDPLVLVIGSGTVGFGFCAVNLGTLVACRWSFQKVNALAADIVKVCVFWTAFRAVVTLKLCFLPL